LSIAGDLQELLPQIEARRTMREFCRAAVVTLAGPAAEDRFCLYTADQRAEMWNTAWREDLFDAMHHGGAMFPVKRAAERLVREQWDSIERVAEALSERGELTGDEVDALLVGGGRGEITRASGVPTRSPSPGR